MSLVVKNLQRAVSFNVEVLRYHTTILVKVFGIENYDLGVLCVNKKHIQNVNKTYRHTDTPTDILSFPYCQGIIPGELPKPDPMTGDCNLGDVFLCLPVIREQCLQEQRDLQCSLPVFVTHGICHLLGYTHYTKQNWKKMYSKETEILTTFGQLTGIESTPLTSYWHEGS